MITHEEAVVHTESIAISSVEKIEAWRQYGVSQEMEIEQVPDGTKTGDQMGGFHERSERIQTSKEPPIH